MLLITIEYYLYVCRFYNYLCVLFCALGCATEDIRQVGRVVGFFKIAFLSSMSILCDGYRWILLSQRFTCSVFTKDDPVADIPMSRSFLT